MSIYDQLHQFRAGTGSSDSSGSPTSGSGINPEHSKVKRSLFGPVDHEENLRFVQRELARNRREATERWNYDFENDKPIQGRYEWEKIVPPKVTRDDCDDTSTDSGGAGAATAALLSSTQQSSVRRRSLADSSNTPINFEPVDNNVCSEKTSITSGAHPVSSKMLTSSETSASGGGGASITSATTITSRTESPTNMTSNKTGAKNYQSGIINQRQPSISTYFQQRKRSKSKVKVQERRKSCSPSSSHHETACISTQNKPIQDQGAENRN